MTIGRHEPGQAKGTDLKGAIVILLDEALTALEESFHDLTDEQFWAFPIEGRHNIVTIVEHCIDSLDLYGCEVQAGEPVLQHEERFDIWNHSPEQLRDKMADLPGVADVVERLRAIAATARKILDGQEAGVLQSLRPGTWWADQAERTCLDAYMRVTMHVMSHVRQIWLMRGAMGLTDKDGWPEQHWA